MMRGSSAAGASGGNSKKRKHAAAKHAVGEDPAGKARPDGISKKEQKRRKQAQAANASGPAPGGAPASQAVAMQPSTSGRPAAQAFAMGGGSSSSKRKGTSLLGKMREQLWGGRFRWLNERLYTIEGSEALRIMQQDPGLYGQYHEGFRKQTAGWPQQPVDLALEWLSAKPKSWVVADLGCGDARVAAEAGQKVHSFDLISVVPGVVACNMARLPLPAASLDAALFCLSLMGTDYGSFLEEAARVLRPAGHLWIAEVQSRFVDEQGTNGLDDFVKAVCSLGFKLRHKDASNSYFVVLEFQGRAGRRVGGQGMTPTWPALRACQYKKR